MNRLLKSSSSGRPRAVVAEGAVDRLLTKKPSIEVKSRFLEKKRDLAQETLKKQKTPVKAGVFVRIRMEPAIGFEPMTS